MATKTRPSQTEIRHSFMVLDILSHKIEPPPRMKWEEYAAAKKKLPVDLTPEQYEQKCKRIAEEMGI